MPYEAFEHTADIGLRIWSKDLPGLFRDAAQGFFDLVTDLRSIPKPPLVPSREVEMNFQEDNAAELFMHWLQELLFVFSTRHLILIDQDFISLTPMMLKLKAQAVLFDPKRHVSRHEIKAVTYHQFSVTQTRSGWEAKVIFDI